MRMYFRRPLCTHIAHLYPGLDGGMDMNVEFPYNLEHSF